MPQIEVGDNGNFIIDGDRRQRGSYDYIFLGNNVLEVFPVHDTKERSYKGVFPDEWTKAGAVAFTDEADFIAYIDSFFFFVASGGEAPPPSNDNTAVGTILNANITVDVAVPFTHTLGTTDILLELWDIGTGEAIVAKYDNRQLNTVDITFVGAKPTGDVRVIVKK